jgi:hypothetical protein
MRGQLCIEVRDGLMVLCREYSTYGAATMGRHIVDRLIG